MTPESIAREIATFRELIAEANLLRDAFRGQFAELRRLLDIQRDNNNEMRRLKGLPEEDEKPPRPTLNLVKNELPALDR